ncbi:MAG: hypothetical protein LUD72_06660 [Bacteroidales bacterium]|nr:hypothetical protein [Bacteroidales bacterium]
MANSRCKTCAHEQVCKYTEEMDRAEKFMEQAVEELKSRMGQTHLEEGIITVDTTPSCHMYMEFKLGGTSTTLR